MKRLNKKALKWTSSGFHWGW